jgi:hypothetical protein
MVGDMPQLSDADVEASAPNEAGYRCFSLGSFTFSRDEYFAHVEWVSKGTKLSHTMSADVFLRALMRDVAWGFFYGTVNFDDVFGTRNRYGQVEFFAGCYHPTYKSQGLDHLETFDSGLAMRTCKAILHDWTNTGYDPFAAPMETGLTWIGKKVGHNTAAINRARDACRRMPGLPGDLPLRTDRNRYPVNRAFLDVPQDEPEIHAAPGFEGEVHAFNLFAYLSRSDVTWNPSVSSVCKHSLFCPTTEEYILPVKHANDRIEWFLQLSDQIEWHVEDGETGLPRANITMRPGDVAAMPADIRHQGFARKRAMLLVWENADPELPRLHEQGAAPRTPAEEFWPARRPPKK